MLSKTCSDWKGEKRWKSSCFSSEGCVIVGNITMHMKLWLTSFKLTMAAYSIFQLCQGEGASICQYPPTRMNIEQLLCIWHWPTEIPPWLLTTIVMIIIIMINDDLQYFQKEEGDAICQYPPTRMNSSNLTLANWNLTIPSSSGWRLGRYQGVSGGGEYKPKASSVNFNGFKNYQQTPQLGYWSVWNGAV